MRIDQDVEGRGPAAFSAALGVAGAHEHPVRPGIEACQVAQLAKVSPDAHQRLLGRIGGEVIVTENPGGHREQAVAQRHREQPEGLPVTLLRSFHQPAVHGSSAHWPRRSVRHATHTGLLGVSTAQSVQLTGRIYGDGVALGVAADVASGSMRVRTVPPNGCRPPRCSASVSSSRSSS